MTRSPARLAAGSLGADPGGWPGRTGLVVLPFLAMAAVAVADVLAGPRFGFLSLMSLGPALAAVALGPGQTVLIGGLAVAVSVLLASYDGLLVSERLLISVATIVGVTATGVVASAGRQRRERELANVRVVAEAAQRVLLRPLAAEASEISVAVRYISAAAAAKIGGDLYDVIVSGGTARLIVADVQGKGLAAVQTASVVLGAFREAAYDATDLPDLAARIELSLERQAGEEEFVTAVLAQIPPGRDSIEILNCGHPPPLLLTGGSASFAEPPETGLPLGLASLARVPSKPRVVPLQPGDRILFYTDGISEARDKSGAFYPLDACAALLAGPDPDAALGRLCDDVIRHVGHDLQDDAAILLFSQPGGSDPARPGADPRLETS